MWVNDLLERPTISKAREVERPEIGGSHREAACGTSTPKAASLGFRRPVIAQLAPIPGRSSRKPLSFAGVARERDSRALHARALKTPLARPPAS
jgi:hypothetical protein